MIVRSVDATSPPRRRVAALLLGGLLVLAFAGFVALGAWQLQRMAWKQALIERVEARIHAEASPPPSRAAWPTVTDAGDAYRRVRLRGRFLAVADTRTQAVTALGAGAWLLAPFQTIDGDVILVNRGFVPSGADVVAPPSGEVTVTGLLRISEPRGGFLRRNDPAQERWHSRDVAAIAAARGLPAGRVAPFFIDAERDAAVQAWPRGGMTVVAFRDPHLSYALTWFGMALLTVLAGWRLVVSGRGLRHDRAQDSLRTDHAATLQPR